MRNSRKTPKLSEWSQQPRRSSKPARSSRTRVLAGSLWTRLRPLITRKRMLIAGGIFVAFLLLTPVLTYAYYARDISDRERLMNRNNTGIVLKDRNGEVFYEYGRVNGNNDTRLDQISDNVEKALIASEDKAFYEHEGYSLRGIAGALYGNILNKNATRYGGSTLTQQLVKNNLLSSSKSYLRKYQEISMAIAVERNYSKEEILEMYLNSVYFGEGAFGIADASKTYFNKSPADLTVGESAMLVGLLPAPNAYSPISGDEELAAKQQKRVLSKMVEEGHITAAEQRTIGAETLQYAEESAKVETFEYAQHYALMVLDELNEKYGEERVTRSGFEVTTTLDLNYQKEAEEIIQRRVAAYTSAGGRNASLVAIDPNTGFVNALVGSVDWDNESFGKVNMALSPRQPGSSFKPIYHAEALDKKIITAATIVKDSPRDFAGYRPNNFDFKFKGDMPVRNALAESRNITAVEVMQKLGTEEASTAARRMGLSTVTEPEKYGLTLALGTAETKLYDMTNAYAAFANEGEQFEPVLVTSIKDKFENNIFQYDQRRGTRVIGREAAFIISSILSDNAARAPTFGSSLNIPGRQVAVKTGTTDENKDAWTIGYTPGMAVGVWVGNNENEPMRGLAGGSSAGVIWREAMTGFVGDLPRETFEVPSGIWQVKVCRSGGGSYNEYFIRGTEPADTCTSSRPPAEEKKPEEEPVQEVEERPQTEVIENPDEPAETEEPEIQPPNTEPAPTDTDNDTTTGDTTEGGRGGGDGVGQPPAEEPVEPLAGEEAGTTPQTQNRRPR